MVSKLERNIWFSIVGCIYSIGIYKIIKNYNTVSLDNYNLSKSRTKAFIQNKSNKDINAIYSDHLRKIFLLLPVETDLIRIDNSINLIKGIYNELTPDNIFLEKPAIK